MKYIISENTLEKVIMNHIDKYYDMDDIHWTHMEDDFGNEIEGVEFYRGDYMDDDTIFRWYGSRYWTDDNTYKKELSPIVTIEDENFTNEMTGFFNDKWIPVFKEWFNKNFDMFGAKTIDYYN